MNFLEIHRFSDIGEKARTIRCIPGRVTVFRARSEDELQTYRLALEGKRPAEEFSLVLDSQPFNPQDHFFIGFGARDESPTSQTVSEYLIRWGVEPEKIKASLSTMGLDDLSQQRCTDLSPVTWRMVRQIACFDGVSNRKVFFLNDPFLEFSTHALELFADCWVRLAVKQQIVVIVTRLSERPECWIENDFIARIQLERPRQATIGYGGGETTGPSPYEIKKMRAAMLAEKGTLTDVVRPSLISRIIHTPRIAILTACLAALFIGASVSITKLRLAKDNVTIVSVQSEKTAQNQANSPQESLHMAQSAQPLSEANKPQNTTEPPHSIAQGFPEEIQLAWESAVEHPESLLIAAKVAEHTDYEGAETSKFKAFYKFLAN